MKKLHRFWVLGALGALILLSTACERNAEPSLNRVGWAYYPLSLGQYHLYDVYRINYNFATANDTLSYELKEQLTDYFIDQDKDTVYVMQRLRRSNASAEWQLDSAYLVQRTPIWLAQTVNNRQTVQLMFPVAEGRTWNGNLLNAAPADSFRMEAVGKPYEAGNQVYENSLRVVQENILNTIVETDQREEVYAHGVGLVYKYINNLKYCTKPDCYGQEKISTGLYLKMSLKETGIEPL